MGGCGVVETLQRVQGDTNNCTVLHAAAMAGRYNQAGNGIGNAAGVLGGPGAVAQAFVNAYKKPVAVKSLK